MHNQLKYTFRDWPQPFRHRRFSSVHTQLSWLQATYIPSGSIINCFPAGKNAACPSWDSEKKYVPKEGGCLSWETSTYKHIQRVTSLQSFLFPKGHVKSHLQPQNSTRNDETMRRDMGKTRQESPAVVLLLVRSHMNWKRNISHFLMALACLWPPQKQPPPGTDSHHEGGAAQRKRSSQPTHTPSFGSIDLPVALQSCLAATMEYGEGSRVFNEQALEREEICPSPPKRNLESRSQYLLCLTP